MFKLYEVIAHRLRKDDVGPGERTDKRGEQFVRPRGQILLTYFSHRLRAGRRYAHRIHDLGWCEHPIRHHRGYRVFSQLFPQADPRRPSERRQVKRAAHARAIFPSRQRRLVPQNHQPRVAAHHFPSRRIDSFDAMPVKNPPRQLGYAYRAHNSVGCHYAWHIAGEQRTCIGANHVRAQGGSKLTRQCPFACAARADDFNFQRDRGIMRLAPHGLNKVPDSC